MHPADRQKLIFKKITNQGKAKIYELSQEFNVSEMTVRRDLRKLEQEKKIIRSDGNALLVKDLITETPYLKKESERVRQKQEIAEKAISLIQEGNTIILDSGTTTLEIAKLLQNKKNITIITNDIKIAAELINSKLNVIVTGGELQNEVGALFGSYTSKILSEFYVDILFLGAHAIDTYHGVTTPTFEKSIIKKQMIQASENTWLVSDSNKLNKNLFSKVCNLDEITGFITDDNILELDKSKYKKYVDVI